MSLDSDSCDVSLADVQTLESPNKQHLKSHANLVPIKSCFRIFMDVRIEYLKYENMLSMAGQVKVGGTTSYIYIYLEEAVVVTRFRCLV